MLKKTATTLALSVLLGTVSFAASADRAVKVESIIWANGAIYGTILTNTSFKNPPAKSTDVLYNFDMSGLTGQRPVAEAAPGEKDYNGGRWTVKFPVFTDLGKSVHDPDGDGAVNFELMSDNAIAAHESMGHFIIMDSDISFECPLIP